MLLEPLLLKPKIALRTASTQPKLEFEEQTMPTIRFVCALALPVGILLGSLGAALLFGFADALQNFLSILNVPISSYFLLMAPYLATLLVVAGVVGRARPPAADGKPYVKQ